VIAKARKRDGTKRSKASFTTSHQGPIRFCEKKSSFPSGHPRPEGRKRRTRGDNKVSAYTIERFTVKAGLSAFHRNEGIVSIRRGRGDSNSLHRREGAGELE